MRVFYSHGISSEWRYYTVLSPVEYISNLCDSICTVVQKLLQKVQICPTYV